MAAAGDEDGGGEGKREAPPVADTWAVSWPAGTEVGLDSEVDAGAVAVADDHVVEARSAVR